MDLQASRARTRARNACTQARARNSPKDLAQADRPSGCMSISKQSNGFAFQFFDVRLLLIVGHLFFDSFDIRQSLADSGFGFALHAHRGEPWVASCSDFEERRVYCVRSAFSRTRVRNACMQARARNSRSDLAQADRPSGSMFVNLYWCISRKACARLAQANRPYIRMLACFSVCKLVQGTRATTLRKQIVQVAVCL